MKKLFLMTICCLCILLLQQSAAEMRTISWEAVTTYTDNTFIDLQIYTVVYEVYWNTSPDFFLPSLHTIAVNILGTSKTFDAFTEGLPRQTTVYFTAKARLLNTEDVSDFAPAYAWYVPPLPTPGKPTLNSAALGR